MSKHWAVSGDEAAAADLCTASEDQRSGEKANYDDGCGHAASTTPYVARAPPALPGARRAHEQPANLRKPDRRTKGFATDTSALVMRT